jgi:hypothetical protein
MMLLACASAPVAAAPDGFWAAWGDGNAELAGYRLTQPRYGELREGTAATVVVTEDFSWSERVKADPGEHAERDLRKVLKLNMARDFLTGIYPYHVLTSAFLRVDAGDGMKAMDPIKVAFSATEWCGMVYDELRMTAGYVHADGHTYFDKDGRPPSTIAVGDDVVYGDALPLVVRGFGPGAGPHRYYPASIDSRFAHHEPIVGQVEIRAGASRTVAVPAGSFAVHEVITDVRDGETTTWLVEDAAPHRLIGWSSTSGEHAELTGVERLPYWQLNRPGDESYRARLGL